MKLVCWVVRISLFVVFRVSASQNNETVVLEAPFSSDEQYLEPYVDQLLDYRADPVAANYVVLTNFIDILPARFMEMFTGSKFTFPLGIDIPVQYPIRILGYDIPVNFNVQMDSITFNSDLKTVYPLKLNKNSKFTWDTNVALNELDVRVQFSVKLDQWWFPAKMFDITMDMRMHQPRMSASTIVAMNRTRICETWGEAFQSSARCAAWSISVPDSQKAISGLNITHLSLLMDDSELSASVTGNIIADLVNFLFQPKLQDQLKKWKNYITGFLASGKHIKDLINNFALEKLPTLEPCGIAAYTEAVPRKMVGGLTSAITNAINATTVGFPNVSQICVVNNAAFLLQWRVQNCPARTTTAETRPYMTTQTQCMNVHDVFGKELKSGDVVRVGMHANLGLHSVADPPLRYVEDAGMSAGFACSGINLNYKCDLISVAPTDMEVIPSAKTVCILNQAAFPMDWDAMNLRSQKSTTRTSVYHINQMRCMDLASGDRDVKDGDLFQVQVHAVLGRSLPTDRHVKYSSKSKENVAFVCSGVSLLYSCKLLTSATSSTAAEDDLQETQIVV